MMKYFTNRVDMSLAFIVLIVLLPMRSNADNPIIKHIRTADPDAHVWNDGKVWVYTSHDQDTATNYGSMDGYHVFSTSDLVNWKDHGEILHSRDVSWAAGGNMYAPCAAYKNNKYYLYFPTMDRFTWKWRVGVAVSDKPEGPFKDIGNYIQNTDSFDPCCFIDDDGVAYLYWGGGSQGSTIPKVAKLKENMIELAETPRSVEYGADKLNKTDMFGEGGYMHKRNGTYYFSYNGSGGKYATGKSPYGPFEYKGVVNANKMTGSQDHHSIIQLQGKSYFFYHIGNYNGGSLYRRNVCVDYLNYNSDGTMQVVNLTSKGVDPVMITSVNNRAFTSAAQIKSGDYITTFLNGIHNDPVSYNNCNLVYDLTGKTVQRNTIGIQKKSLGCTLLLVKKY